MGNIFGKNKKEQSVMASPPEDEESIAEANEIEKLNNQKEVNNNTSNKKEVEYREIPVCMSQEQINNLVIENNIILKQIIADMNN